VSRNWRPALDDLILFCERALQYTAGLDRDTFFADTRTFDATMRNIELIGEAARSIPEETRQRYPHVPWVRIVATRNIIIHQYFGIDHDIIWDVIQTKVPELLAAARSIRAAEFGA
jgi:uncharacterized protein with HEPN domain